VQERGACPLRHNDVSDEFKTLTGFAFSSSCVSHEPLIFSEMTRLKGNNAENQAQQEAATVEDVSEEAQPAENEDPYVVRSEIRGDKNVHGFWKHGRTCMRRFLKITRRRKRGSTLLPVICHEWRRDFTPLVYSVDSMASQDTLNPSMTES
jgi:hypothetical protein